MKELTLFLTVILLAACNNNAPGDDNDVDTLKVDSVAVSWPATSSMCFVDSAKGNRIRLSLRRNGSEAEGTLDYAISGKDKNTGTFEGLFSGDTLTARYTFNAEGTESVREIKFLISDSAAVEGYGQVQQRDGRASFVPKARITYGKGIVLKRADCKE